MRRFEWIVALRYLRAKRKQTVISVITFISIIGVAAGVASLIIALAINNGFATTLQSSLLAATAHIRIEEKHPSFGIENWRGLIPKLGKISHIKTVTPGLYDQVGLRGPIVSVGAILKGVPLGGDSPIPDMLHHLKSGSLQAFDNPSTANRSIILGVELARQAGVVVGAPVTVIGSQLTPMSIQPSLYHFRVAGIFESGLYDLDSTWAFTTLKAAQSVLDYSDVVNAIELRLDNLYEANAVAEAIKPVIGPKLVAQTWMTQNRSLLSALKLEKVVSLITVSLIELVAALNILVVLVMLVMEKQRDIALLMTMGARRRQIRRIFVLQGLIIGSVGVALGLIAGFTVTFLFNRYRWLSLDEQIYSISYVPFLSHWTDAVWVSALALFTCFVATLHPSRTASRVAPVEALRYE
jgi:lipoprotein-releasing system permease protein